MSVYVPGAESKNSPEAVISGEPDQLPPAGVPARLILPLISWQTVISGPAFTTGGSITVTIKLSAVLHRFSAAVYFSLYAPFPDCCGLNSPDGVIFIPDQLPPTGEPVNCTGPELLQTRLSLPAFTSGYGCTVTVTNAVS